MEVVRLQIILQRIWDLPRITLGSGRTEDWVNWVKQNWFDMFFMV